MASLAFNMAVAHKTLEDVNSSLFFLVRLLFSSLDLLSAKNMRLKSM
jgi:hypothetical protein